jgi:MFS transporter, FSR family, fosmidomycin resistance protein
MLTRMSQGKALFPVLVALSLGHLINDTIQSLLPAIYPIIKQSYQLDFGQIGFLTLTFQLAACIFQPIVGHVNDKNPMPFSIVAGMAFSLAGLLTLAYAGTYEGLLIGATLVGLGSSIFHPEATRMARQASGGQLGMAQAIFVVGGQTGSAIGPLLAAFIIVPGGQTSIAWFSMIAMVGAMVLGWACRRFLAAARQAIMQSKKTATGPATSPATVKRQVVWSVIILMLLLFSKTAYSASFNSFYTFYLIEKFNISMQASQYMLFLFLVASAFGSLVGGWIGDKFGRTYIIWFSIVGALPFTMILPHVDLFWTAILTVVINVIMSSALASIIVYAMELLPGRTGMVGGLFYGLAFGFGGLSAAALGALADQTSIETVYHLCAYLPAIGLLAFWLPKVDQPAKS